MKNNYLKIFFLTAFLSVSFFLNSCTKVTTATVLIPTLNTINAIIDVTSTTAQSGGTISNEGNGIITANGVCYSTTNQTPTTADSKTTDAVVSANVAYPTFTSNLKGLTPGTLYYLRAYATNSAGTGYGAVIKFTTASNLAALNSTVTTFAGNGTPGYADGTGISALFNNPQGVTVDSKGNVYVGDSFNNYIREISPAGVTSTIAGNGTIGFLNGTGSSAEFYAPQGLAFDASSNLYVSDFGNNVIRKITAAGVVSTYVGTGEAGYNDGTDPLFYYYNNPTGVAFDASGNMYIADKGNNVIRKITSAGVSSTLAGSTTASAGYLDGTGTAAYFNKPSSVAVDASGNVYVADEGNNALRKITSAGVVTTIAGGPTAPTLLNLPAGLAIDASGNIYIADEGGRIMEYTTANVLYILAGSLNVQGFTNGTGANATFNQPQALAIDANGNIYVADKNNNCIRKITVSMVP